MIDSTILPGRERSITMKITTHDLPEGDFKKGIIVRSNAKNTPTLRLYISGYFKTVLEVEQRPAIRLSAVSDTGAIIRLRISKKLNVEKVEFKFKEIELGMEWETALPIKFTYEYIESSKTDSKETRKKYKNNPMICQIRLFYSSALKEDKWGEFSITTDLKAKKVVTVPGMLEGKK